MWFWMCSSIWTRILRAKIICINRGRSIYRMSQKMGHFKDLTFIDSFGAISAHVPEHIGTYRFRHKSSDCHKISDMKKYLCRNWTELIKKWSKPWNIKFWKCSIFKTPCRVEDWTIDCADSVSDWSSSRSFCIFSKNFSIWAKFGRL